MPARAKIPSATAITEYKVGDAAAAISGAAKVLEAVYWSEYCYHAQMEPMNAVAKVAEDGQSAEIWTGTQFGALAAGIISGMLEDHAGQDQGQPADAGRRLRPAHLAGCGDPGDVALQHHQEAGEADPRRARMTSPPPGRGR